MEQPSPYTTATEPVFKSWGVTSTEACLPQSPGSATTEASTMRSLRATTREKPEQQERPSTPLNKQIDTFKKTEEEEWEAAKETRYQSARRKELGQSSASGRLLREINTAILGEKTYINKQHCLGCFQSLWNRFGALRGRTPVETNGACIPDTVGSGQRHLSKCWGHYCSRNLALKLAFQPKRNLFGPCFSAR